MPATTTRAWHGRPELRDEVLERMIKHRQHDEIIQGFFQQTNPTRGSGYKGCLIGCTLPNLNWDAPSLGWHGEVEARYGISEKANRLLEQVFECLPQGAHAEFAVEYVRCIKPGADLDMACAAFVRDLLADPSFGACQLVTDPQVQAATQRVIGLLNGHLAGATVPEPAWAEAARAARASGWPASEGINTHVANAAAAATELTDVHCGTNVLALTSAALYSATGRFDQTERQRWYAQRLLHHLRTAPVPA